MLVIVKLGGRVHKLWLWSMDLERPAWFVDQDGVELCWRYTYCAINGHDVTDDQCMRPEHRFCSVCTKRTPHEEIKEGTR